MDGLHACMHGGYLDINIKCIIGTCMQRQVLYYIMQIAKV